MQTKQQQTNLPIDSVQFQNTLASDEQFCFGFLTNYHNLSNAPFSEITRQHNNIISGTLLSKTRSALDNSLSQYGTFCLVLS